MKTKEEIEQLAQEIHYEFQNQGLDANGCFNQYQGFIKGYTQCQEDMADKKYTEEDMIAFAYQFSSINVADFRKHLKDFDINLKNKQD